MTILIKAQHHSIAHKMMGYVKPNYFCWWRVGVLPREDKVDEIKMVAFTDGDRIIALGKFLSVNDMPKRIHFGPLLEVNIPLEVKPATRGWKYIDDELIIKYIPAEELELPDPYESRGRGQSEYDS